MMPVRSFYPILFLLTGNISQKTSPSTTGSRVQSDAPGSIPPHGGGESAGPRFFIYYQKGNA